MRIAVVGGTGRAGKHTVEALRRSGHDTVVIARSRGVDIFSGEGLDEALDGVDTVVDASNVRANDADETRRLFETGTRNILAAEERAGVRHHVLLSIVGIDRIDGNAHWQGKRAQEQAVAAGAVPYTIQRTTQFHEFAGMIMSWARQGDTAYLPPVIMQPVAAVDVGAVLAEVAVGEPQGRAPDLAGPEPQDLVDMVRRMLHASGESLRLIPSWQNGLFGVEAAGGALLPDAGARLAATTFDQWLARQSRSPTQ